MKVTVKQKRLREEAILFPEKYKNPKNGFEKLKFYYSKFEVLRQAIRDLPKGYAAFNKTINDFSEAKISGIRNKVEKEIISVEGTPREEKLVYKKIPESYDLERFINLADSYRRDVLTKYRLNSTWLVYYFEPPLNSEYGRPKLGNAMLRTANNKLEAEFFKQDFSFEPNETRYSGSYQYHTNEDNDDVLVFELKSSSDRSISIVTDVKNATKADDVTGIGTFSQFDGKRIHSSRILLIELGFNLSLNEAKIARNDSLKRIKHSIHLDAYTEALSLRSSNYICSINKVQDTLGMLWSSEFDANTKFVDYEKPAAIISSDILFLRERDFKDLKSFVIYEMEGDFDFDNIILTKKKASLIYNLQKKMLAVKSRLEQKELTALVKLRIAKELYIPPRVSYFIHVHLGVKDSATAMTYMGWAMCSCKHLLFIYDEKKTSEELLSFINNNSVNTALSFTIRLLPFANLDQESEYIERSIVDFVQYTK
ncbi:MAG: hypothetical protein ABJG41_14845 [Cyclobacteriaceae bacterium]